MNEKYKNEVIAMNEEEIQTYLKEKTREYYNKQKAIIVDIDGTIANHNGVRSPYDYEKVEGDAFVGVVGDAVNRYKQDHQIIFVSGRDGSCRSKTVRWLRKNGFQDPLLLMRNISDKRQDDEVKKEFLDKCILPHYTVSVVFDDRNRVVSMWRANGLTCFQVQDGDF